MNNNYELSIKIENGQIEPLPAYDDSSKIGETERIIFGIIYQQNDE